MAFFVIQTTQEFNVTYRVEAENEGEAWSELVLDPDHAEVMDQSPADINGKFEDADIQEDD